MKEENEPIKTSNNENEHEKVNDVKKNSSNNILKNISWFDWYESTLPEWVRLFKDSDYKIVDHWMKDLANFYDGHTENNKLIDQLVGAEKTDKIGYFTKSKLILMLEDWWVPLWMFCLNFKRWWSVKIWPVVVAPEARWKWIWKLLFSTIDKIGNDFDIRKLYATTSHLNERINKIFPKYWFIVEATYPNQYKKWSNELIRWKMKDKKEDKNKSKITKSVHSEIIPQWKMHITNELVEKDIEYINNVLEIYNQWHNDLWEDFLNMMIKWYKRWKEDLWFQNKSKEILIAKDDKWNHLWLIVFSPKRWWPVKIYPISWTTKAQDEMTKRSIEIAKENGCHKLYTFAHESDTKQIECLKKIWFIERWTLISPYKEENNLITFDLIF